MENIRGKILWIDDEIQHLKPHIMYLESKGYNIDSTNNGNDGIILAKKNKYDIVLLDQNMPGMDGLSTLKELKINNSLVTIIMITKTEDEWLMDEAIIEKVEQFLIKPVNPSQIFMACKQALERALIRSEKLMKDYLNEIRKIDDDLNLDLDIDKWWKLYDRLVDWQIKFDEHKDMGINHILNDQSKNCNKEFSFFIEKNYCEWLKSKNRPVLSSKVREK